MVVLLSRVEGGEYGVLGHDAVGWVDLVERDDVEENGGNGGAHGGGDPVDPDVVLRRVVVVLHLGAQAEQAERGAERTC